MKKMNNMALVVKMANANNKNKNMEVNNKKSVIKPDNNKKKKTKDKKFSLGYYVEKCLRIAFSRGFKIHGAKMRAVAMFENDGLKYVLAIDKQELFWAVEVANLVAAVDRSFHEKTDDDSYLTRYHVPTYYALEMMIMWEWKLRLNY